MGGWVRNVLSPFHVVDDILEHIILSLSMYSQTVVPPPVYNVPPPSILSAAHYEFNVRLNFQKSDTGRNKKLRRFVTIITGSEGLK